MRHGTRLVFEDGRLAAVVDRRGHELVALAWDGDALVGLEVAPPPRADLPVTLIRGERVAHVLFGNAHPVLTSRASEPVTWMGAVDWARPGSIPPIEHPFRIPASAGTMILNTLAILVENAGVPAVRYAGPYPTRALWESIEHSFRTVRSGDDETAFTAGALERAARADMSPVPVDFAPAPFERVWVAPGIAAQLRDGVERVTIQGDTYARGDGVRRLVAAEHAGIAANAGRIAAEVWLGGAPYARVAVFADDGELVGAPAAIPPHASTIDGQVLPAPLRAALAELVAELLPPPLAPSAADVLASMHVEWGDAGAAAIRDRGDRVIVHAALWDRLAPRGLGHVALALAEALAPAVAARAQARLAALLAAAVSG